MPSPAPTVQSVLQALRAVQDPDLHQDIVTLGFVKDPTVKGGDVAFTIDLTTPACPAREQMKADAERLVRAIPGVTSVSVSMTATVRATLSATGANALPAVRNIVAVGSGKGGVGKSTVAANLAAGLAALGARVGLLDADIYGPSIPTMFGCDEKPGTVEIGGRRLIAPVERHGVKLMSMGFLVEPDRAVVWRGPMLHGALRQFFGEVHWGELDYLIVDLPPGTGDVALTMAQSVTLTGAVIVSTPQTVSILDARKALSMFRQTNIHVLGMVENMSGPVFGAGGVKAWSEEAGVRFLGEIPLVAGVRASGDAGVPAVLDRDATISAPFRALAEQLASAVSVRNIEAPQQRPISISV